jgi:glycosyltransferase involved in cell wall biosynthesis
MGMQAGKIKLLKFVANFGIGGTERHVVNLGKALDSSRFEVHFACLKRWGPFLGEIEARQMPISEYRIKSFYDYRSLGQQLRFAQDVRDRSIHIVHAYNVYANVFAIPAARLAGVPVVVASIRDTGVYLTPIQKRVQRMMCRLAGCILVNAEAVRQHLIGEGYRQERIVVIRNGVDVSRFAGKHNGGQLRAELGLPPRAPLVATLARLNRLKGMEYFLEAAVRVAKRIPEARFLVVGDDLRAGSGVLQDGAGSRTALQRHAVELGLGGRVVFTGFRLDVPELLSETAVFVHPSLSEALPNVVLEAMAAGAPVVATRVGGTPEAVEEGVTGLLVPPRDAPALAQAICKLLQSPDLASRFGQAGRQRVAEQFSLERMARETEHLYLKLLSRAGDRGE